MLRQKILPLIGEGFLYPADKDSYLMDVNNRFHLGPPSQLIQIKLARPTICVSGTNPQNLLSWLL